VHGCEAVEPFFVDAYFAMLSHDLHGAFSQGDVPAGPVEFVGVGGAGEFGQFLRQDILPSLGVIHVSVIERETPREEHQSFLETARHVVLATPLAGYAERACELIYQSRTLDQTTTLWLIPSVQAGVWRAVSATLELVTK